MNLNEILGSLKRDWKENKGFGTPPDSWWVGGQLSGVCLPTFNTNSNSKQHQIFKTSNFHEFY